MKKVVFGLVHDAAHAQRIHDKLREAGFSAKQIDYHCCHKEVSSPLDEAPLRNEALHHCLFSFKNTTKAPEGGMIGGIMGGGVGAVFGALIGVGVVALPDFGFLAAAGPILSMLAGSGLGAWFGGLIGVLIGLTYPEYEAGHYKPGKVLIAVESSSCERASAIKDILKKEQAIDISACAHGTCCGKCKK